MQADAPRSADKVSFIRAKRLWDGEAEAFISASLRIKSGLIDAVGAYDEAFADGADVLDMGEAWVMPGLINTHVHLEFGGDASPMGYFYRHTATQRVLLALANARELLQSGVTTARDCGSSWDLMALAKAPEFVTAQLPRLQFCGPPITTPGPAGHLHFFGGAVQSRLDVAAHIHKLVANEAAATKVMVSGGNTTPGSDPAATLFSTEDLTHLVETSREQGLTTIGHVLGKESLKRALLAGIANLEHCSFFVRTAAGELLRDYDAAVAHSVARSGAYVMPNLSTGARRFDEFNPEAPSSDEMRRRYDLRAEGQRNFLKLHQLGVSFTLGTDAGVAETPFSDTWREFALMRDAGLSGVQAIRIATSGAAAAVGLRDKIGRLALGYAADLTALRTNPLEDPNAYARPSAVVKSGRLVHTQRA